MSKSNVFETAFLSLIFNGDAIANLADNAASSPATNLYLALHTADPGETGDQSTNECTYGDYARTAVSRSSNGFTVYGNVANLTSVASFPQATSGSETATHFSLGLAASGAGVLLWSGAISPTIAISNGVIPQLGVGTTITED